jgi:hypothetical protein
MKLYLKEFHLGNLAGRRVSIRDEKNVIKSVGTVFPDRPTEFPTTIAEKIKKTYGSTVGEWDKDGGDAKLPAQIKKQIEDMRIAARPAPRPGARRPTVTHRKKKSGDEEEVLDKDKGNLTSDAGGADGDEGKTDNP